MRKNTGRYSILSLLLILFPALPPLPAQTGGRLFIEAGKFDHPSGPVFFLLPKGWKGDLLLLTNEDTQGRALAQRWNRDSAVFMLDAPLEAGLVRRYRFEPWKGTVPQDLIMRLEADSAKISLFAGADPVLVYHTDTVAPPAGEPAYFQSSGFVHPLYSPAGKVLTDDFPASHRHQHGLFMAWTNTTFRGEPHDFWNVQQQTGTVRHAAVLDTVSGPVFARFRVRLEHVSLRHGPVLEEERTITVYNHPGQFILDVRSLQRPVTKDTLFLNEYHYGGFAFRGSAAWNEADSANYRAPMQVLTGEIKTRADANHTRPRWIAAYGPLDGQTAGIAVLDHPGNFRHPQPVRVHPEMPYFVFAPMVAGAFTIGPGDTYESRYRCYTFRGEPSPTAVNRWWLHYALPVQTKVE